MYLETSDSVAFDSHEHICHFDQFHLQNNTIYNLKNVHMYFILQIFYNIKIITYMFVDRC